MIQDARMSKYPFPALADMSKIHGFFAQRSQGFVLSFGASLLASIGAINFLSSHEFELDLLYLLPIGLITWYAHGRHGYVAALAAALIWGLTDTSMLDGSTPVAIRIWDTFIQWASYSVTVGLLSVLKDRSFRLEQLARLDPLTGLANRRTFRRAVEMEASRSLRYGLLFSLVYLDVDDFKLINDTTGHLAGDETLRNVACVLSQSTRESDTVGRLGGDEFAVLLPQTNVQGALRVAHRIQDMLSKTDMPVQKPVTFSIGVVAFKRPPGSFDEIIGHADAVMYSVKMNRKNGIGLREWPSEQRSNLESVDQRGVVSDPAPL